MQPLRIVHRILGADAGGALVAEAAEDVEAVITASFDLDQLRQARDNWFVFRDRRPDLYAPLGSFSTR